MNSLLSPVKRSLAVLAILASAILTTDADAARGRPVFNAQKSTYVSDSGTLLRGAQMATDGGGTYPETTIAAIKDYGLNAVHLYAEKWGQSYSVGGRAAAVDAIVQHTRNHGLYLIITIGSGGVNQQFASDFWNFYAGRYANETHVIYEIQNEATWSAPSTGAVISLEQTCYNIIRSKAPNTPVLFFSYVAFNSGAGVVQDIQSIGTGVNWNNAAIAFHGYGEGGRSMTRATMQYVINAGYPIFQTEFYQWPWGTGDFYLGDGPSMYQDVDQTGDCERLGVSWLSFCTLNLVRTDARFKDRIRNAGILWTPDYGTWPSGSRGVYGNGLEPRVAALGTTLRVEAEHFDTGGQNISYKDNEAANNGGALRTTEGVDIQTTTDTGGGQNVGWITAGEWLEYTIYVQNAARYELRLRVASPNASASARVLVAGEDKTGAWTFNGTGGYQTWTTITKVIDLPPGQQVLHLDAITSGFNLNWIELSPVTVGAVPNGTYKIINRNSGRALDVVDASTANGAKLQQWGYSGTLNQKWVLTHRGGNQYTITSAQTGKGIDEASHTALSGDYIDVWSLWNGVGSTNQRWLINATDSGYFNIACAHSGLVLEIVGASVSNGARVEQAEFVGGNDQQWIFQAP